LWFNNFLTDKKQSLFRWTIESQSPHLQPHPLSASGTHLAAAILKDQFLMVEPQQMQDRRVPIVKVDFTLDCLVSVLIGLAVGDWR